MDNQHQIRVLKRMCALNFAEIHHLKTMLFKHLGIKEGAYDFEANLDQYIKQMEAKLHLIEKDFNGL